MVLAGAAAMILSNPNRPRCMSDTMNETHIHDPRPLARSGLKACFSCRAKRLMRQVKTGHIKDRSFVKRPLVDIAQADDAPPDRQYRKYQACQQHR